MIKKLFLLLVAGVRLHFSKKICCFWLLLGMIGFAVSPLLTHAQSEYPQPRDPYLNDYANLVTAQDRANIRAVLSGLRQDTGIEAVVVTINTIHDYDTGDRTIESFATNLFNDWGIGDPQKNDGVLILVAVRDQTVRIEMGSGYGTSQNASMQEAIDEFMLPSFRQDQYSQGVYRGALAVVGTLTGDWPEELSAPLFTGTEPNPSLLSRISYTVWLIILGSLTLAGAVTFSLYQKYKRYLPRRCRRCATFTRRLAAQNTYLDDGQILEVELGTATYDVWECPACNQHTVYRYLTEFMDHRVCPDCGYRTIVITTNFLSEATLESTGCMQIVRACRHCDYLNEEIAVLPVLTPVNENRPVERRRNDDSWDSDDDRRSPDLSGNGRRSFGGGSSSGKGGASGKW